MLEDVCGADDPRPVPAGHHVRHHWFRCCTWRPPRRHYRARQGHASRDRLPPFLSLGGCVVREKYNRVRASRALSHPGPRQVPRAHDEEGRRIPIQINMVVLGKEFPPYAVTLDAARSRSRAAIVGPQPPVSTSTTRVERLRVGYVIAPPTILAHLPRRWRGHQRCSARSGHVPSLRLLHGEQELERIATQPWQTTSARSNSVDISRRAARSSRWPSSCANAITYRYKRARAMMRAVTCGVLL